MKKSLLSIIAIITITVSSFAENVNIPDANFKKYLLDNISINTDNNKTEISVAEAIAFTGAINVPSSDIASLSGIEEFINIAQLYCSHNQLSSLDISKCIVLTQLDCSNNKLSGLDISKNTALKYLWCYNNQISVLDLTMNVDLEFFDCSNNQINAIDVTKNNTLLFLYCSLNPFTCIQALNSQNKTDWRKDPTTNYSENCNYVQGVNDEIITSAKTITSIYNLQGQSVNNTYKGLVIIRYTDGTSEKVVQYN